MLRHVAISTKRLSWRRSLPQRGTNAGYLFATRRQRFQNLMPDGVSIVLGIAMPAKPELRLASSFTDTVFTNKSASPQAKEMETNQHSC